MAAQHLLALASEPEALAVEDDDLGMVDEAVDDRGDGDRVADDLGPGAERLVEPHDQRPALVEGAGQGEEQCPSLPIERAVADIDYPAPFEACANLIVLQQLSLQS